MGNNRSPAHTRVQRAGRKRDGNRCQVCDSKDHVEGQHIIDHQFGGAANIDNIENRLRIKIRIKIFILVLSLFSFEILILE